MNERPERKHKRRAMSDLPLNLRSIISSFLLDSVTIKSEILAKSITKKEAHVYEYRWLLVAI